MRAVNYGLAMTLIAFTGNVVAYKQATHAAISKVAVEQSALNDTSGKVLEGLELRLDDKRNVLPSTSPFALTLTPLRLIQRGAEDEDGGQRTLNHFYDPQNSGRGMTYLTLEFEPSPSWIVDGAEQDANEEMSYRKAKALLLDALFGQSKSARDVSLGRTFEALGHVIHHLQDMAQPQHVRNDIHCDEWMTRLFESSWVRLPICPALLAYKPSAYEDYTWERVRATPPGGYGPVDYGTFSDPKRLWGDGGIGIAEFTGSNFVSAGRNFRGDDGMITTDPAYPNPNGARTFIERRQITDPDLLGPNQSLAGEIWFIGTPVVDRYRPSEVLNKRASTYSIFDGDLKDVGAQSVFTLNSFNYQAANEFLLPRAAAYSTGLINYFFRGRIGIALPEEGVYGVLDHATINAAGQGFAKLKLKLSNASPDGVKPSGDRVPQTMQGGTLVAVAKYTLNSCYQPDLTGDYAGRFDTGQVFPPANCSFEQYVAGEEQISQSAAQLAVTLDKTPAEFVFDFSSQPIPVNARDLRIQVVYTGQLGAEADGIAFGGRDISEPTHLVVYNNSDYFLLDGRFYTPAQIRSDPALAQRVAGMDIDARPLATVSLSVVNGKPIVGPSGAIPVNGYTRVAVLADRDTPFNLNVLSRFEGGGFSVSSFAGIPPAVIDLRDDDAFITSYGIFRGPRGNFFDVVFKANSDAPILDDGLTVMSGRMLADPGPTPIPVRF